MGRGTDTAPKLQSRTELAAGLPRFFDPEYSREMAVDLAATLAVACPAGQCGESPARTARNDMLLRQVVVNIGRAELIHAQRA